MTAAMRSTPRWLVSGLALVVCTAGAASAQPVLQCPFTGPFWFDTGGGWCTGPLMPRWEFPPTCGCPEGNFFLVICSGPGYGGIANGCRFQDCHVDVDYSRPCPLLKVDPPEEPDQCSGDASPSAPPPPMCTGKPVRLTTGAVFFTHTDANVGDLALSRTYSSLRTASERHGVLGPGWNASFEKRLRNANVNSLEVRDSDGLARYYQDSNGDGTYEAVLPASKESWVESIEGGAGGYRRVLRAGGSETYDPGGLVRSVTDAAGVETAFAYDPQGRVSSLSRLGRSIGLV